MSLTKYLKKRVEYDDIIKEFLVAYERANGRPFDGVISTNVEAGGWFIFQTGNSRRNVRKWELLLWTKNMASRPEDPQ